MNILEVKQTIAAKSGKPLLSLDLGRQMIDDPSGDIDPVTTKVKQLPTEWYGYWDNDNRIRIVMHEQIFIMLKTAKANGNVLSVTGLAIKPVQHEEAHVTNGKTIAAYDRYVIITPNIEASF